MHKLKFHDEYSKTAIHVRIPDSCFNDFIYSIPRGRLFEAFGMDYDKWIEEKGNEEWDYRLKKEVDE